MRSKKHSNWPRVTVGYTVGLTLSVVGCVTYDRTQQEVEYTVEQWRRHQASSTENSRIGSLKPQDSEASPNEVRTARGETASASIVARRPVDVYITEALSRNPDIRAAMADVRAKLERIAQVTSLPDPKIRAIVRPEPIQTAAGDVFFTFGVRQTFPLPERLERAGHIAAAETRMALQRLNSKRVALIADVERAYWRIYRLDRDLEITRQNEQLLRDLESVVNTRYQVGKVLQQDLLRVQTELARLRDDRHRFERQRATAVAALNQLTDYPLQRAAATTTPIDVTEVTASVDRLVALAADHSPQLAEIREQVERDRERVKLSNLGHLPDVTLGFEWNYVEGRDAFVPPVNPTTGIRPVSNRKSEAGDDNWAVMLQMNLPIWTHRIDAAKREARQRLVASRNELHSAENRVAFRIFDAWSRIEAQQHTLGVLDSELIPQAAQTYEVTLTAYQSGDSDFLTLIENWRRWLDFELMRYRESVDLETAFAELQREVGLQLISDGEASSTGEPNHD